jgi:RNA polymerase sigma factor (sigma-70 family)
VTEGESRSGRPASPSRDVELERFYRTDHPKLLRFLVYHGARPADAADAAHCAWVEVCRRWDQVQRMKSPSGYLRTTALHEWRRLSSRPQQERDRAVKGKWIDLAAVEDIYGRDDVRVVQESLAALPDRQRQVMAWLYDGYAPEEIAEQLGMRVSTVRSTIRHARAKLRALGVGRKEG